MIWNDISMSYEMNPDQFCHLLHETSMRHELAHRERHPTKCHRRREHETGHEEKENAFHRDLGFW
jgi:hypothetical protein